METKNFEVIMWENLYYVENGVIDFKNGIAGNGIIYKQFDKLEQAKDFYNSIKLENPKTRETKRCEELVTQEKLIIGANNETIMQEENKNLEKK